MSDCMSRRCPQCGGWMMVFGREIGKARKRVFAYVRCDSCDRGAVIPDDVEMPISEDPDSSVFELKKWSDPFDV